MRRFYRSEAVGSIAPRWHVEQLIARFGSSVRFSIFFSCSLIPRCIAVISRAARLPWGFRPRVTLDFSNTPQFEYKSSVIY